MIISCSIIIPVGGSSLEGKDCHHYAGFYSLVLSRFRFCGGIWRSTAVSILTPREETSECAKEKQKRVKSAQQK